MPRKLPEAARRTLVLVLVAQLAGIHLAYAQKARRPSQKRGAHAAGISPEEEHPARRQPQKQDRQVKLPPGIHVAVRFDSERSIFQNSGRWTRYPDDIYLEPDEDAIYMIETRAADSSNDASGLTAEIFAKYRVHVNSVCPSNLSERLSDPLLLKRLDEAYRMAAESQRSLFNRTLSYEEYVGNVPDCEVIGNLWRTATRFADPEWKRMLVRFPSDVQIRESFSPNPEENHASLLKDYLRKEGKIIRSPLATDDAR